MENHNKLRKKQCLKKWKQLIKKVFSRIYKINYFIKINYK